MINNEFLTYKTLKGETKVTLTAKEIARCKAYISAGNKSFCIKDLFGYETWKWSIDHPVFKCIYDAWARVYLKQYDKKYPGYNENLVLQLGYKQAGISLGHFVKEIAREMPNITINNGNTSYWDIIYTVV